MHANFQILKNPENLTPKDSSNLSFIGHNFAKCGKICNFGQNHTNIRFLSRDLHLMHIAIDLRVLSKLQS